MKNFHGNLVLALAAYNAGPAKVRAWNLDPWGRDQDDLIAAYIERAGRLYREWFDAFPVNIWKRLIRSWQEPGRDPKEPWRDSTHYLFAALELSNVVIALQPPRGYGMNPDAIYHTPDLPPTHHYTAFYRWLGAPRSEGGWEADAIVHVGKHGTLEWLPGKGIGLSAECFPDLLLGDMPLVYPFIINDPGEGSQAKPPSTSTTFKFGISSSTPSQTRLVTSACIDCT